MFFQWLIGFAIFCALIWLFFKAFEKAAPDLGLGDMVDDTPTPTRETLEKKIEELKKIKEHLAVVSKEQTTTGELVKATAELKEAEEALNQLDRDLLDAKSNKKPA